MPIRPERRLVVVAVALIGLAAVPAFAVNRITDWRKGEQAPREIVENLASYTPQLGFNPEPDKAVLVAQDAHVRLYVTTNRQGTYCYVASTRLDGGTCVSEAVADAPVIAGFIGGDGQHRTNGLVLVGRIRDHRAQTVRFTAPAGESVVRNIGRGGFFVAIAPAGSPMAACAGGGWTPTFTFYSALGDEIASAGIEIARAFGPPNRPRGCAFPGPHPPD
jgi:hypothetical protein